MISERKIRKVLRKLARQRVRLVLQPGNVWVIDRAVKHTEETDAILNTCYMRGWVEPIVNAIPRGKLTPDGKLPEGEMFDSIGPVYRITEAGWIIIHRSYELTILSIILAICALIISIIK